MSSSAVFDQGYYLTNNADVVVAISQGFFASAVDHYTIHGGKELRQPNATFDPNYYAINNSDVLNAVSNGTFASVFSHFQQFGESENRAPNTNLASFDAAGYLAANADVAAAVTAGTFTSALDHYIAFGQTENRDGSGVTEATNPGSTFNLTSSADGFTGTAQADTFNATLVNEGGVANVQTMNALDSIDGGDGSDTINIQISADVTPTALTSIENIALTAVADAAVGTDNAVDTFGASNATGLTSLTFSATGDDDGVTVTGVQNLLSGGVNLKNSAVNTTVTSVNTAVAGAADALTIDLQAVTAGTITIDPTSGTNGYESFTINSNGSAANALTGFDDGTSTSGTTINIGGAQNLNMGAALPTAFTTISAANATGNVTVNLTGAAVHNVTGGTGDDVFDLSGSFVDGTTAASRDTVDGGDGTDVLVLDDGEVTLVGSAAQFNTITNIETVRMDTEITATSNFSNLTGVTTIEFDGTSANNVRANGLSYTINSGTEIQFDTVDTGTEAMTFIVAGSGTTDSMTIDINGVDMGNGVVTYTGIETVNIATSGTSLLDGAQTLPTSAANEAMNISGTGTLTLGAVTADTVTSTMTGTGTLTLSLAAATNFTGGANIDAVVGSTSADIISGGASADTIQNRAAGAAPTANDILTGGDGFDTFVLIGDSASTTNYSGSPTITDFTVSATAGQTDLLAFSANDTSYNDDGNTDSGLADGAAGVDDVGTGDSVVIQSVAQSNGAAAVGGATTNFFKLTTAVAFTTNLQGTFNAAIGTSSVTGLNGDSQYLYSLYDTTNDVMVIGTADANGGAATITLTTADVVNLVATVSMTDAEYALIDADNFAVFIA
jgi:hypothetical protein